MPQDIICNLSECLNEEHASDLNANSQLFAELVILYNDIDVKKDFWQSMLIEI